MELGMNQNEMDQNENDEKDQNGSREVVSKRENKPKAKRKREDEEDREDERSQKRRKEDCRNKVKEGMESFEEDRDDLRWYMCETRMFKFQNRELRLEKDRLERKIWKDIEDEKKKGEYLEKMREEG